MLSRIKARIKRKRARSFLVNIHAWHQTCVEVSEIMGGVLHDQSIMKMDIGYIVETTDRMLFHMRYYIPDSLGTLRRRNPKLAHRFDDACQQIFDQKGADGKGQQPSAEADKEPFTHE